MKTHGEVLQGILAEESAEFRKDYEDSLWIVDLVALRTRAGLTQKQVAERVGTTQSVISRLESGGQEPSLRFLRKVVEAIGGKLELKIEGPDQPLPIQVQPPAPRQVDATV